MTSNIEINYDNPELREPRRKRDSATREYQTKMNEFGVDKFKKISLHDKPKWKYVVC